MPLYTVPVSVRKLSCTHSSLHPSLTLSPLYSTTLLCRSLIQGFAFQMCNISVSPGRRPTRQWQLESSKLVPEPSKRTRKNSLSVSSSHKWMKTILQINPPFIIHFLPLVPITSLNFRRAPAPFKQTQNSLSKLTINNKITLLNSWSVKEKERNAWRRQQQPGGRKGRGIKRIHYGLCINVSWWN